MQRHEFILSELFFSFRKDKNKEAISFYFFNTLIYSFIPQPPIDDRKLNIESTQYHKVRISLVDYLKKLKEIHCLHSIFTL